MSTKAFNWTIPSFNDTEQKWREYHEEYEEKFTTEIYQAHIAIAQKYPFIYNEYGLPREDQSMPNVPVYKVSTYLTLVVIILYNISINTVQTTLL